MLCHFYSRIFQLVKAPKLCSDELCRFLTVHSAKRNEKQVALEEENDILTENEAEVAERERLIEKKRNKSRLYPQHRNMVHNKIPYTEENPVPFDYLKSLRYNRRLYGRYGAVSKVDPRIAWPTKEEILEWNEYESLAYPSNIQSMLNEELEKIRAKEEEILKRDKEMVGKLNKLDQWKKEVREKILKNKAEADAARLKKERLMEEVRRHFGFSVDIRDERFQQMMEAKEKEEKKALKLAKKQAKHDAMISKLLKMADEDKKERESEKKDAKVESTSSQD